MRRLLNTTITILVLAFPIAALANLTGTPTLSSGQILNLDTGTVVTSGGDILWNGSTITPQGGATAISATSFGLSGATEFNSLVSSGPSILSSFASLLSSAPIPASSLTVGGIFAVKTNGGNLAGALVTAQSGTSITLQFITFIATVPTITQVLNNYGLIPGGFTNSGIAPGSLFIIKGSLLASATTAVLQSSAAPGLSTTLNGASVKVTVNGTTTVPVFYYAIASQLALVMPSNTPTGSGQVTVTYNGQTSSPFNITVVASAMGFDAYNGTGSGLGVATNAVTGALYSYTNSIPPGTTVVLWGSGLGADPARDTTFVGAAFSINGLAQIYIGGAPASIGYQGASGYPGVNQVNVTIPANAPTGCNVSLVGVTAGGLPTNFLTLPIGTGVCQDPVYGITGAAYNPPPGQTTVNTGFVSLDYLTQPATSGSGTNVNVSATASFESYTGSTFGSSSGSVSLGGCSVIESVTATASTGTTTGLDAGNITVSGSAGSDVLSPLASLFPTVAASEVGIYESVNATGASTLPAGFLTTAGGTFTYTGSGGKDVGPFMTQIVFSSPLLTWTNQAADATVTRSAGLPVTWTGGAPGTYVVMSGSASSGSVFGFFTCIAPVSALQFTVPPYVLAILPAGKGFLTVENSTVPQTFTATGLNTGAAYGFVGYEINSMYN